MADARHEVPSLPTQYATAASPGFSTWMRLGDTLGMVREKEFQGPASNSSCSGQTTAMGFRPSALGVGPAVPARGDETAGIHQVAQDRRPRRPAESGPHLHQQGSEATVEPDHQAIVAGGGHHGRHPVELGGSERQWLLHWALAADSEVVVATRANSTPSASFRWGSNIDEA